MRKINHLKVNQKGQMIELVHNNTEVITIFAQVARGKIEYVK